MNMGMPCVYILCPNRGKQTYVKIWEYLFAKAPGLRARLRFVMVELKRSHGDLVQALRESFPDVPIRGCWFNFIKTISLHWEEFGLRNIQEAAVQDIIELARNLPLLPATDFSRAIQFFRAKATEVCIEYKDTVIKFVDYIEKQWKPIADITSLWKLPVRTNSNSKSFNRSLLKRFGCHPDMDIFLEKLKLLISVTDCNWRDLDRDGNVIKTIDRKQLDIDLYIHERQDALHSSRITVETFLMELKTKTVKDYLLKGHRSIGKADCCDPAEIATLFGVPATESNEPANQATDDELDKVISNVEDTEMAEAVTEPETIESSRIRISGVRRPKGKSNSSQKNKTPSRLSARIARRNQK